MYGGLIELYGASELIPAFVPVNCENEFPDVVKGRHTFT